MIHVGRRCVVAAVALCTWAAQGDETKAADDASRNSLRYTFSWPLDAAGLKPRGGTTRGPAVQPVSEPSAEWRALQAPGLSEFERDRRAILAMAGTYRVTFDFLEVASFTGEDKPNAPYQSWGTEKVYVDLDDGKAISLVHILEMRIVEQEGSISEPFVTKHWRQDWRYEPEHIVEHRGRDRWERRKLAAAERKHSWVQTVYQVDESPRYASPGRWQHSASFSSWMSGETWRPLPRREWSVRDDYQVLIGTNRHTVLPTGWLQEENNLKAVLTKQRELDNARPYAAREYGMARYERIAAADFAAADEYFQRTRAFWDQVSDAWSDLFAKQGAATLKGPVDKLGLFRPLFARADEIAAQAGTVQAGTGNDGNASTDNDRIIRAALREMGALR